MAELDTGMFFFIFAKPLDRPPGQARRLWG
jgi:hypothetical protein